MVHVPLRDACAVASVRPVSPGGSSLPSAHEAITQCTSCMLGSWIKTKRLPSPVVNFVRVRLGSGGGAGSCWPSVGLASAGPASTGLATGAAVLVLAAGFSVTGFAVTGAAAGGFTTGCCATPVAESEQTAAIAKLLSMAPNRGRDCRSLGQRETVPARLLVRWVPESRAGATDASFAGGDEVDDFLAEGVAVQ